MESKSKKKRTEDKLRCNFWRAFYLFVINSIELLFAELIEHKLKCFQNSIHINRPIEREPRANVKTM